MNRFTIRRGSRVPVLFVADGYPSPIQENHFRRCREIQLWPLLRPVGGDCPPSLFRGLVLAASRPLPSVQAWLHFLVVPATFLLLLLVPVHAARTDHLRLALMYVCIA